MYVVHLHDFTVRRCTDDFEGYETLAARGSTALTAVSLAHKLEVFAIADCDVSLATGKQQQQLCSYVSSDFRR